MLRLISNASVEEIPSGCEMAGSFGYEKYIYDIFIQRGEDRLLPAVRQADGDTIITTAGTSCRHQFADGT